MLLVQQAAPCWDLGLWAQAVSGGAVQVPSAAPKVQGSLSSPWAHGAARLPSSSSTGPGLNGAMCCPPQALPWPSRSPKDKGRHLPHQLPPR